MKISGLLIFLGLVLQGKVSAQTQAITFDKGLYRAGSQNWAIDEDTLGNLFFANNEGLLVFNGAKWQFYPLPNNTIVRSLAAGPGNRIYAGGQDELGYFEPDAAGQLVYRSLLPLLDSVHRQFADIWNIVIAGDEVFFRSFSRIFRFHNQKVTTFPAASKWTLLAKAQNRLIAHDSRQGLLVFANNRWEKLAPADQLQEDPGFTSVTTLNQNSLFSSATGKFYLLGQNKLTPFFLSGAITGLHVTSSITLPHQEVLLGTYDHGLLHVDSLGRVLEVIGKANGLGSDNIKCIFRDKRNKVWVGLEDGISLLEINSPVKWLNAPQFNGAPGYAVTSVGDKLYLAMANGVYEMPVNKQGDYRLALQQVKKIAGGLSWNVENLDGALLAGRDDGFFTFNGKEWMPVDRSTGYWTFKTLQAAPGELHFAAGNYTGITLFKKQHGAFVKNLDLGYLNTSARFAEYDPAQKSLWVSHPYRGVYKILLNPVTTRLYNNKSGLPSALQNHIFKVNNQVVVATEKGVYEYHAAADSFRPSARYAKIFAGLSLRYLKDDGRGNLWFVSEKRAGVWRKSTPAPVFFPELYRKINSGFEHVFPLDENNIFVGGDRGFYHINLKNYLDKRAKPAVFIRNVTARFRKDSVLSGGFGVQDYGREKPSVRLPHKWNALHFEFASPENIPVQTQSFSYRLTGFEQTWSGWDEKTEKDYTNIPPGNYVFEVKSRNHFNEESQVAVFAFEVMAPWYQTLFARFAYVLLACLLVYFLLKRQEKILKISQVKKMQAERQKFEEQQKLQAYEHQLALEKSERELMQLKNEKLESELASSAMNLVQKKEFLLRIKDEVQKLKNSDKQNIDTAELKKILRGIADEDRLNEEWDQFSLHFNNVHNNFLLNLKNKFPNLTAHDLKLCAYLRMNLSSKEMARLMSISLRGVEINRYRLRKKLQLKPKEDLFRFLLEIEEEGSRQGPPDKPERQVH